MNKAYIEEIKNFLQDGNITEGHLAIFEQRGMVGAPGKTQHGYKISNEAESWLTEYFNRCCEHGVNWYGAVSHNPDKVVSFDDFMKWYNS